jgi:hypothetical protein
MVTAKRLTSHFTYGFRRDANTHKETDFYVICISIYVSWHSAPSSASLLSNENRELLSPTEKLLESKADLLHLVLRL